MRRPRYCGAGVQLTGLNFYAGTCPPASAGVFHPSRTAEFRANVDVVAEIARATGCRRFNALHGNRLDGLGAGAADDGARKPPPRRKPSRPLDGTVLLEPVSGVPAYPLRTAADALAVVDAVDRENVRLLADFYHLAVTAASRRHRSPCRGLRTRPVADARSPPTGHRRAAAARAGWPVHRELATPGDVALEYTPSREDPFASLPVGRHESRVTGRVPGRTVHVRASARAVPARSAGRRASTARRRRLEWPETHRRALRP
ncbi:TIM barrel protein [Kocuria rhizophila]|nr:TIM barrel protein [Kocuria rhizophila]